MIYMMSKTIETKLFLHYMIFRFQGTQCLEMYAFVGVLAVVIVRTINTFFSPEIEIAFVPCYSGIDALDSHYQCF